MKIASLILAAGGSSRLGSPKQLVEYNGEILLTKITRLSLRVTENVLVVLGANEQLIRPRLNQLLETDAHRIKISINTRWREGIGSSISFGVKHLPKEADAVLILLCDQPFVDENLLNMIVQTYANTSCNIVACHYQGQFGVPILFDKKHFNELIALQGDQGAKKFLSKYLAEIKRVDFPEGIYDIDTPEDIEKVKALKKEHRSS